MSDTTELNFIWGAGAIAREICRPVRATFHLLENGEIPAQKVGGRWVADRQILRSFLRGESVQPAE